MSFARVCIRCLSLLILGTLQFTAPVVSLAQTPEAALVLKKTDLFDADGKVVGKAAEGDVLVVLIGGDRALIAGGGPPKARSITSKHVAFPSQPAGKALLEKLIAADTKNPEHYRLHASNCWYAKDYEGMVADFTRVIELTPNDPQAYRSRSGAWMKLNKYDEALADLQTVIRIDPKQRPNTLNGLLGVYKAQADWPKVVDLYTEKLDQEKRFGKFVESQNLAGRGAAREALKQWDQAKSDYDAALKLNPRNRQASAGLKRIDERE